MAQKAKITRKSTKHAKIVRSGQNCPPDCWLQQKGEPFRSYEIFRDFLQIEPENRYKMDFLAQKYDISEQKIQKMAQKYSWIDRAKVFDEYQRARLVESVQQRDLKIDLARQSLVDRLPKYVEVITRIANGDLGDSDADRLGRPYVKPADQLQAALNGVAMAGLTIPKRVELSGPDGSPLLFEAREALGALTVVQLQQISQILIEEKKEQEK